MSFKAYAAGSLRRHSVFFISLVAKEELPNLVSAVFFASPSIISIEGRLSTGYDLVMLHSV